MASTQSNDVVLIRIAGNVLCCIPNGSAPLRIRKVGVSTSTPPDQSKAMALLRPHVKRVR